MHSIDAGFGVVCNIVAPRSNYPRGVYGSESPRYGGGRVYHYFTAMGYREGSQGRAVWIADSGFAPYGYWISLEQLATLIPPKGYTYAATAAPNPKTPTTQEDFLMSNRPVQSIINPNVTFSDATELLRVVDATNFANRALLDAICKKLDLQPQDIIDAAVAADRSK